MRKNRTARSETGFSSYKIGAIDVNIKLVTDYAVVYTPSSCNGHGIISLYISTTTSINATFLHHK